MKKDNFTQYMSAGPGGPCRFTGIQLIADEWAAVFEQVNPGIVEHFPAKEHRKPQSHGPWVSTFSFRCEPAPDGCSTEHMVAHLQAGIDTVLPGSHGLFVVAAQDGDIVLGVAERPCIGCPMPATKGDYCAPCARGRCVVEILPG